MSVMPLASVGHKEYVSGLDVACEPSFGDSCSSCKVSLQEMGAVRS